MILCKKVSFVIRVRNFERVNLVININSSNLLDFLL